MARKMACTNKLYKPLIYQDFFSALQNTVGLFLYSFQNKTNHLNHELFHGLNF
jgi:hypothetical protein